MLGLNYIHVSERVPEVLLPQPNWQNFIIQLFKLSFIKWIHTRLKWGTINPMYPDVYSVFQIYRNFYNIVCLGILLTWNGCQWSLVMVTYSKYQCHLILPSNILLQIRNVPMGELNERGSGAPPPPPPPPPPPCRKPHVVDGRRAH